jgi:tripartite-type tricarboxylate transporter receptor subunit TctC
MVDYAKKNGKALAVAGPGTGGMMNLIALESGKASGTTVTYVPFSGGGPSGLALLGGQVDYRVAQPSEVLANVRAGKTQVLAVGFPTRLPELLDVPTFREVGIALDVPTFGFDLWAPPNLPPAIATQLSSALELALKDPEFIEISKRLTYQPAYMRGDELRHKAADFESNIAPRLQAAFPLEDAQKK